MSGFLRNTLDQARKAQDEGTTQPEASKPAGKPQATQAQSAAVTPGGDTGPERGRPKTGKRSDPSYERLTALVRKETRKQVDLRMLQDPASPQDLSELVEMLLSTWAHGQTV